MRIGYVQTSPILGDVAANLEAAERLIAQAAGADLLVLPELFGTGYAMADRDAVAAVAEDRDGPTLAWARRISAERGVALAAGFARRDGDGLFNSSFLVDGETVLGFYDKAHLFHRERYLFDPGTGPFEPIECRGTAVGLMICYDWQFPEVCRSLALAGARVIAHPSNLVLPWGQSAMRIRSLENGVFSVTANRVGAEEDLSFTGGSQITGPRGDVLSLAPTTGEAVFVVEIDPDDAADKSTTPLADRFADRRPELYGRLCRDKD